MKKSPGKSKPAAQPAKMQCDGHWVEGNIWFKIGLSKTESEMVKTIAGRIWDKRCNPFGGTSTKPPSGATLRALLQTCLAHYDVFEPLLIQDVNYSQAEGFSVPDLYLKGVIAQQHEKLAGWKGVAE